MIRSVPRIAATCLVLSATAVLVAACGGSGDTSANPSRPITRAQAIAFAKAVNLRAADVPGSKLVEREREDMKVEPANLEYERCAGGVDPHREVTLISLPSSESGREARPTSLHRA